MNQISRIDPAPGTDRLGGYVHDQAVGLALHAAWQKVFSGDQAGARTIVAKAVNAHQHQLDRDVGLLAETVAVLAAARGFVAIDRLFRATGRGPVKLSLAEDPPDCFGPTGPLTVSPARVADPATALDWSESLLQQHPPT